MTGQGEVLVREWEQFIFICDPLFQHNTHCLCLHEDIPKGYRVGLHKNSLRNSSEGCNSEKMGENTHTAHRRLLKEYFYKVLLKHLQWLGSKCHWHTQWLGSKCHFFHSTHYHYKCIETPRCHSNQTRKLIFINNTKSVKAYRMNISIKPQFHRVYGL